MIQPKVSEVIRSSIRASLVDSGEDGSRSGPESFKARTRAIRAGNVITSLGGLNGALETMVGARKARSKQKGELSSLNNRFASYIQKVHALQQRNCMLEAQVVKLQSTKTIAHTKPLYQKETRALRMLVDQLSEDKAKMAIERNQWKEQAEEYKKKWEEEAAWHAELNTEVAKLNKDLDAMRLIRVDLQNKTATMQEEIDFMVTVHKQELKQLQDQLNERLSVVAVEEAPEPGPVLISELYDLWQLVEDFLFRGVREETETKYEEKVSEFELERQRQNKTMQAARGTIITTQQEVPEVEEQLNTFVTSTETRKIQSGSLGTNIEETETRMLKEFGELAIGNLEIAEDQEDEPEDDVAYREVPRTHGYQDDDEYVETANYRMLLDEEDLTDRIFMEVNQA